MNAASPCVYLWGDIINHKNVAARVNVTGVDPSRSGFEPGSRCPCERGDSLHQVYAKRSALRDGRSTVVVYRASSTADRYDILYHLIAN